MNISHLERFLTTSPDTTSGADEPPLDLDNICLLRARSMRKFVRALESIATRYAGDGDEEADDVVDLARLEVVEDRGYIRNRLALQPLSSPSSNKGKQRADPRLQLFDLLDPPSHDADPDEWGEIDGQSGGTEDEDYTMTNALFERLKKRVQERASDISRHRLHKASTTGRAEEEPCGFSSPSSVIDGHVGLALVGADDDGADAFAVPEAAAARERDDAGGAHGSDDGGPADALDQEQADEADRRARESSEDPMLLPASSKKRRHSKPRASGPPLP
ncbi:hypothetical protein PtA15_1A596 [Puccinia triticina]|uniref:Uncharacterized protein n=1 Tax=Puccinia triticina TaxID=208348 RepID=A0ABY7C7W9_9BASI|nr:uncharacterized protein PtA15_1A596 [Puccinia triticina]WAQ81256.1 hypothetical protein PtA15_1A596 [Puccinia triticina]WAR52143.1 hypothetical protein PtB15_1B582 [Puccinia triticina]